MSRRGADLKPLLLSKELLGPLAEAIDGMKGLNLFDHPLDQVLGQDLGIACDIVDVLLGIECGQLASRLGKRIDQPDGEVAQTQIEGSKEANRPRADHDDVGPGHIGTIAVPGFVDKSSSLLGERLEAARVFEDQLAVAGADISLPGELTDDFGHRLPHRADR
jgi:hypothetical protein